MVRGKEIEGAGLDVGFLCQGWMPDVGGVERHTHDLAARLGERGHRVHVLCLDYTEGLEPYSTRDEVLDGVAVRRMAYLYQDQRAVVDMVENDRACDVVLAWLAETPCDLVHVHHATGFGLGALRAIEEVGQPLVMTLHDYWPLCPRGQMLTGQGVVCERPEAEVCGPCIQATWPGLEVTDAAGEAAERTRIALDCLSRPQRLISPSARAREIYVAAGLDPQGIERVENGIETDRLAQEVKRLREGRSREPGRVALGVLGVALPSKGVLELARALRRVDAVGLTLEVHGAVPPYHGDASYAQALEELAAEEPRLRLHGAFEPGDLPRILANLDGVAAPSVWEEVFGLTVREAAAVGLPVLVSDAGGLPEVARGGRCGLVVARGDEDAWVAALERFATDDEARAGWANAPQGPRTTLEMALQLERIYVETIREVTGEVPALAHPLEGLTPSPEQARGGRGWLGRLLGRRGG